MRILIAGTASHAADLAKRDAARDFTFDAVETGEELLAFAASTKYHTIVLTNELPDRDGVAVLKQLRASGDITPIIALIAGKDDHETRVAYFWAGADHVLQMPYHLDEFVARTKAAMRTASHYEATDNIVRGDLQIDLFKRIVRVKGEIVHLTRNQFLVMEALALANGHCSKEKLLDYMYGFEEDAAGIRFVDVLISQIRKKLITASSGQNFIETLWGRGYKLIVPVPGDICSPDTVPTTPRKFYTTGGMPKAKAHPSAAQTPDP